ncbi:MAG: GspE/PulE family protein [Candidatus Margulisiibacteriota bacterium]
MNDNIINLLDSIIEEATGTNASDIHIEPREDFVRIRYRIDGLLKDAEPIHKSLQAALISRIKVMVNLDIGESRLPQDGRINLKIKSSEYDLRISTMPTLHGEKVVIRILERRRVLLKLEQLGMNASDLLTYRRMIAKKNGIILVTGPTGSGKTTTLYATIKELNCKENNIVTIEDPVEYQLPGVNQVQVNNKTGLSFAKVLRSVLRQDPDVIMIGEIRDIETARIAIQAALTGHLVLATLHTKDAPSATIRLCEMGIEPYLVKDGMIGVIAQRLIRINPKGRVAIFEVMAGTEPQAGMTRLKERAMDLVKRGMTTSEEAERVISFD